MQLTDMKLTKEDKKAREKEWASSVETQEDYSYGLTIHLDDEAIEKLGLTKADLDAGQPVTLAAEAVISSDNISTINGKTRRSLTLQIQKLGIAQGSAASLTDTLYGGSE